jgi:hypothetical protein
MEGTIIILKILFGSHPNLAYIARVTIEFLARKAKVPPGRMRPSSPL